MYGYDMKIAEKIINYIEEHKISTEEVADILKKTGSVRGSLPLVSGQFKVGIVTYVYGYSDTNWPIHEQLVDIPEDRIVFVDDIKIYHRALFGELVSGFILHNKKSRAIVTKGLMRDASALIAKKWPVWCGGVTPEGCFNMYMDETRDVTRIAKANREYYDGAIAVCDDAGVVIIPKDKINEEFFEQLVHIEEQEKMWFHCVNDLGWTTYDTVCLQKYKEKKADE